MNKKNKFENGIMFRRRRLLPIDPDIAKERGLVMAGCISKISSITKALQIAEENCEYKDFLGWYTLSYNLDKGKIISIDLWYDPFKINEKQVEKRRREIDEKIIPSKQNMKKNYLAFPIEVLPKSFKTPSKKEIDLIKLLLRKMKIKRIKEYYNKKIKLNLDCYLENTNISSVEASKTILSILEGVIFKKASQIKDLSIKIIDVKRDPYNDGRPFVGVVVRKWKDGEKDE